MSDFQEEREAREKMAELKRILEGMLQDKDQQIEELRKHVTELSKQVQLQQEVSIYRPGASCISVVRPYSSTKLENRYNTCSNCL